MNTHKVGSAGNMFFSEETGALGESNVIDTGTLSKVSIFGLVAADEGELRVYQGQSSNPAHMVYCETKSKPTTTKIPDPAAWSNDSVEYEVGDLVKSGDDIFWCIKAHTSDGVTNTTADATLWNDCGVSYPESFHIDIDSAARFIKVIVQNDVLATVTCAAKP